MASSGNTLLALLTGAAIGAGVGILYAPDKGEKTRGKISKKALKEQKRLSKQLKETTAALSDNAQKAKLNFEAKLEDTLSSASYKADDIIVALESKLEDLRKANSKLQKETKEARAKTTAAAAKKGELV